MCKEYTVHDTVLESTNNTHVIENPGKITTSLIPSLDYTEQAPLSFTHRLNLKLNSNK